MATPATPAARKTSKEVTGILHISFPVRYVVRGYDTITSSISDLLATAAISTFRGIGQPFENILSKTSGKKLSSASSKGKTKRRKQTATGTRKRLKNTRKSSKNYDKD